MSGRYQSTVFNFFSRQSMRLRDQSEKTWRQAKIAAVWGVQILLYPIYVAFQTSRLATKQIRQTSRQTNARLQAAKATITHQPDALEAVDRPIRKALQSLTSLEVEQLDQQMLLLPAEGHPDVERELALYLKQHPELRETELQTVNPEVADVAAIRIQGIASSIATRNLVLITTRNQTLDVLTLEQQAHLSQRLAWETATYWRQKRLRSPQSSLLVSRHLPLTQPQRNAWLPVQAFQKVMAWMQRGSVAAAADLFQETQLTPAPTLLGLQAQHMDTIRSAEPSWVALETQFYDWVEKTGRTATGALISVIELGLAAWTRSQTKQPKLPGSDRALTPQLHPGSPNSISASTPAADLVAPASTPGTAPISIAASRPQWLHQLDRWLSSGPSLKSSQPLPPTQLPSTQLPPTQLPSTQLPKLPAQPWLTLDDLSVAETPPPASIPPAPPAQDNWLQRSLRNLLPNRSALSRTQSSQGEQQIKETTALETVIQKQLSRLRQSQRSQSQRSQSQQSQSGLLPQQSSNSGDRAIVHSIPQPAELSFNARSAEAIERLEVPLSSLDTANLEEAAMMPPSWIEIETEAKMVGYVKHPLEQILEWLDRGMAWIETQVAKLWRWFRQTP